MMVKLQIEKDENCNMCSWCTFTLCSFHYLSQDNSKYSIQAICLVYDFSAAPLLFKIETYCVPAEVKSGFRILSQNWNDRTLCSLGPQAKMCPQKARFSAFFSHGKL